MNRGDLIQREAEKRADHAINHSQPARNTSSTTQTESGYWGDPAEMRGVPYIGVGGASPGTAPHTHRHVWHRGRCEMCGRPKPVAH